jgi:hypothetical protein
LSFVCQSVFPSATLTPWKRSPATASKMGETSALSLSAPAGNTNPVLSRRTFFSPFSPWNSTALPGMVH